MGKKATDNKRMLAPSALAAQLDDTCFQNTVKKVTQHMKQKPAIITAVGELVEYLYHHPGEAGRLVSWVRSGVLEAKRATKDAAVFSRSYTGLQNLPKMQLVNEMSQWGQLPKLWLEALAKQGKQGIFDLYCFSLHL
eukprot:11475605-Heterocapsa_arctica.AAC.1